MSEIKRVRTPSATKPLLEPDLFVVKITHRARTHHIIERLWSIQRGARDAGPPTTTHARRRSKQVRPIPAGTPLQEQKAGSVDPQTWLRVALYIQSPDRHSSVLHPPLSFAAYEGGKLLNLNCCPTQLGRPTLEVRSNILSAWNRRCRVCLLPQQLLLVVGAALDGPLRPRNSEPRRRLPTRTWSRCCCCRHARSRSVCNRRQESSVVWRTKQGNIPSNWKTDTSPLPAY